MQHVAGGVADLERAPDRIRPQHFAFEVALSDLPRLVADLEQRNES